ncbi:ABC transporter substrate-binding protein [Pedobacter hartonius]|uniref:Iron complex transport system substrate-binding protein n=1 Tax=Pedobacter hartonius TaxID=425514 RepID=A0A1H4ARQ8_9SPHI|nr:ABC transporter substrate-binding protein [Pedobacter hartonius]SEA38603.1 iron complex transport system substrate-binding protein [Pedobacter hartonius]
MIKKIKNPTRAGTFSCLLVFLLLGSSCRQAPAVKKHTAAKTGAAEIRYAKGFGIDYYDGYKLLNIYSGFGPDADTAQYVLLPKGLKAPEGYAKAQLIEIPVKKLVAMSSTHVAQADFAGVADVITGLGSFKYITSPLVRKNIAAGKVKDVGVDGTMNDEMLISMKPGLVIVMGNPDAKFSKYATLTDAGIPVMLNAEWLETTPLGRAEWVKVMAALTNREKLVNTKFDAIAKEYQRLAKIGRSALAKPSVITGMPFKGVWNVPDGDSYMAQFFKDAGTTYRWMNVTGKGSLALNFETVAPEALKADFWLNAGYVDSKKDIRAIDARYADFKPFKNGNIFNNNKRVNDLGSNDYWESGAVSPQLILADLIKILHPELLPGHQLVYYKQLN